MAEKLDRARVAELAIIHAAPLQRAPMQVDRSFELPGRITPERWACFSHTWPSWQPDFLTRK